MKYDKIIGLEKNISKLIMGNDNQTNYDEASLLWDHWIEVGGNAFDNAHVYGGGSMETLLGKWHKSRNNLKDLLSDLELETSSSVKETILRCRCNEPFTSIKDV